MRLKNILAAVAASSLVAAPVAAAPVANPAQSLSISGARAGTTSVASEQGLGGAGLIGALIGAGVIAIVVIAIVNGDNGNGGSRSR